MAFFLVAMQLTIVLVSEKEEKLKEGLLMMGCIVRQLSPTFFLPILTVFLFVYMSIFVRVGVGVGVGVSAPFGVGVFVCV